MATILTCMYHNVMLYVHFYIQCQVMKKTNDTFSLALFVELGSIVWTGEVYTELTRTGTNIYMVSF